MVNICKSISVLAVAALLTAACGQNGTEPSPDLSFTPESATLLSTGISAGAAGGDYAISFTSATSWHIALPSDTKALVSWLVVTPPEGKGGSYDVTISVLPNETQEARATELSFVSGQIVKSLSVSQSPRSAIAPSAIRLSDSGISLLPGETFQLAATVTPSYADGDLTVSWSSSNPAVATVSDGLVTAVSEGTATISAKSATLTATCTVTVEHLNVPVESLTLDLTSITLEAGSTQLLTATVTPSNADATLSWSSSDPAVATVSDGLVRGVAPGTATITVKAGGKSATCEVTVTEKYVAVESVTLSQTSASLKVGETLQLTVTVSPSDATEQTAVWSSSDTSVVSVENGLVTAMAKGRATVTVTVEGKTATCEILVTSSGNAGEDLDDPITVNPWSL